MVFRIPTGPSGYAMVIDIAALQHMYGANPSNNPGNTTYTLLDSPDTFGGSAQPLDLDGSDGTIAIGAAYYCIWDVSGTNTISYSGSNHAVIDLNTATLSRTDSPSTQAWIQALERTPAFAGLPIGQSDFANSEEGALWTPAQDITNPAYHAGGFFSFIWSDPSTAYPNGYVVPGGYSIAQNAEVQNAVGGSGDDILIGNNLGGDNLSGGGGNDTIVSDGGGDTIDGGSGIDTLILMRRSMTQAVTATFDPAHTNGAFSLPDGTSSRMSNCSSSQRARATIRSPSSRATPVRNPSTAAVAPIQRSWIFRHSGVPYSQGSGPSPTQRPMQPGTPTMFRPPMPAEPMTSA